MRRALGIALAIVLASLLAWWLIGRSAQPEPAEITDREAADAEVAPPRLEPGEPPASSRPGRIDRRDPKSPHAYRERTPEDVTLEVLRATDESPIQGARVRTAEGEETTTDTRGHATVSMMGGTTCCVRMLGYATRWIDVGTPGETVRVLLTPAPTLTGRVVDAASGLPLADTVVRATVQGMAWESADAPEPADEDGVFHVAGVPPGSMFELRLMRPGFATVIVHAGSPAEGDPPLEVSLGEGAVISGVVQDGEGSIEDVDVFVVERGTELPAPASARDLEVVAHAITDDAGRFRIRGIGSPTEVVVHARHRLGAAGQSEVLSIPHDGVDHEVEIELLTHGAIFVQLVDAESGEQVSGDSARCSLDHAWTDARDDQKTFAEGPDGMVLFVEVPAGPHRVFVLPDAHLRPAPMEVDLEPGGSTVITLPLKRGRTVTGRVVDPDGNPLEVYVSFYAEYDGVRQYPNARTDEKEGTFTLKAVPPVAGELSVFDDHIGERTWNDREIAGDLGDLVLASGPHLVGRLPEAMRGTSLRCGINGQRSGGMFDVAEDGTFRIGVLPASERITVYLRPERGAAWVLRDVVLEPGEMRDLGEISFPDALTLEGRILDAGGTPIRDAFVRLADWWCASRMHSDAEGRFRLEYMPPGRSTLWIEATNLAVTFHDVDMQAGMDRLDIRLPELGTLKIRLLRESGETVPGTPMNIVRLLNTGEPDWDRRKIVRTDSQGALDERLPPGPYGVIPHNNAGLEVIGDTMKVLIVSNRTTEADITVK